jgi:hypothetical protein
MFITFRDASTQTFVFNVDAFATLYKAVGDDRTTRFTHIDLEITSTQVIFKLNNEGKGAYLFKGGRNGDFGLRKAIHTPEWIQKLRDANVPFGRLLVRFEDNMFIYENIDAQFPLELSEAKKESDKIKEPVQEIVTATGEGTVGIQDAMKTDSEIQKFIKNIASGGILMNRKQRRKKDRSKKQRCKRKKK